MTFATLDLTDLDLGSLVSEAAWFEPLEDSTENIAELERQKRLSRLVELSSADDGLDWDALARLDIEGWGAERDPE